CLGLSAEHFLQPGKLRGGQLPKFGELPLRVRGALLVGLELRVHRLELLAEPGVAPNDDSLGERAPERRGNSRAIGVESLQIRRYVLGSRRNSRVDVRHEALQARAPHDGACTSLEVRRI